MRNCRKLVVICFCAIVTAVAHVAASLVPDLDLAALATNCDLIAVGRVVVVRDDGPTTVNIQGNILPARRLLAQLDVERTLKGQSKTSPIVMGFSLPHAPAGYAGIPPGQFGVFFLRKAKDRYGILDPYHPFVVGAPGAPRTDGTSLDQVTAELAHVFLSPEASVQTRNEAVDTLRTLHTPAATAALNTAAHDPNPSPRVLAISALLARGDISWLEPAERILLSPGQAIDGYLVWRLASAIEWGVKDPRAIPTLARLLLAKDVNVRRGAAAALRNTRDGAAIKPLTRALYDSDREVQYQAVIGLAEITGTIGEWAPASETFQKDEKRYLDHWREWAKSRQ